MIWVSDSMSYLIFSTILILVISLILQNKYIEKYKKNDIYMQYLINDLPIGIYIKNKNGNILFSNNKFSEISGISRNKLLNVNVTNIYPKEISAIIKQSDDDILTQYKNSTLEIQLSFSKKDSNHYYRLLKYPIHKSPKELLGFIVMLSRIDNEKEAEANKESFIATLAHDLKSPTSAQINMLNLLSNGEFGILNPQQQEMITLTKNSCKYLSDLVATILDTYRFDNGKISLKPKKTDLIEMIANICKGVEKLANDKHQNIIFSHNEDTCFVNADTLQLKRVIANILSNAIQYGYSQTNIYIDLKRENNTIECSIKNKSKPISAKELSRIFDRFNSTSMSHFNNASTGLGLYLTKQIIEMHNGKVFAKSDEDGTCIFGFTLNTDIEPESEKNRIAAGNN